MGDPACFYYCMCPFQYPIYLLISNISPDSLFDMANTRVTCLLIAARYMQHSVMLDLCKRSSNIMV